MEDGKYIAEKLDLDKTEQIFDSLIERTKINSNAPFDEKALKDAKAVISGGNLHVSTARVKVGALRLVGYRDNLGKLKQAIAKKSRKARRGDR